MKRQHPIRKTWKAMAKAWTQPKQEAIIARHVKPLLDALEGKIVHTYQGLCPEKGFPNNAGDPECPACRLLAEWRAKP